MNSTRRSVTPALVARTLLAGRVTRIKLIFVLASLISFALSVGLWFSGHELQGIFVGIWVPSIHSLGALLLGDGREVAR
jgi:hypothetical protein